MIYGATLVLLPKMLFLTLHADDEAGVGDGWMLFCSIKEQTVTLGTTSFSFGVRTAGPSLVVLDSSVPDGWKTESSSSGVPDLDESFVTTHFNCNCLYDEEIFPWLCSAIAAGGKQFIFEGAACKWKNSNCSPPALQEIPGLSFCSVDSLRWYFHQRCYYAFLQILISY